MLRLILKPYSILPDMKTARWLWTFTPKSSIIHLLNYMGRLTEQSTHQKKIRVKIRQKPTKLWV